MTLQLSKSLRERLRAAPAVVALRPNCSQEVVWGQEYLTRSRAMGLATAQILLLRVADDEECRFLNQMVLHLKGVRPPLHPGGGTSAARRAGADRSRQDPGWCMV